MFCHFARQILSFCSLESKIVHASPLTTRQYETLPLKSVFGNDSIFQLRLNKMKWNRHGATTFSKMTISRTECHVTRPRITQTVSLSDDCHYADCHAAECYSVQCHYSQLCSYECFMLSVIVPSVVLFNIILLSIILLNVILLSVIFLFVIMLCSILLSFTLKSLVQLSVINMSVLLLTTMVLSAIQPSVILINVMPPIDKAGNTN